MERNLELAVVLILWLFHDWHKRSYFNFAKSINTIKELILEREALKVHELIDALISSSKNGKRIKVK